MTATALTGGLTGVASGQGDIIGIWLAAAGTDAGQTFDSSGFTTNVTRLVSYDTVRIEETGSHEGVHLDFEIIDKNLGLQAIRGEWPVLVTRQTVSGGVLSVDNMFRGFIRQNTGRYEAKYGGLMISAVDFSSLMDRDCVKTQFKIKAGVNAKAAIQQCFNTMTIVSEYLGGAGLDWSKTRADLGEDGDGLLPDDIKFTVGLTLRQCVERILGSVSASANYRMDTVPRLWTWDATTPSLDASWYTTHAAPYDIVADHTPGAGAVAPEEFRHTWDTEQRIDGIVIDGAKAAGSGTFADRDPLPPALVGTTIDKFNGRILPGPWSGDLFGKSVAPLTGQASTKVQQAIRLARAALIDLRNPIPNGSFTVKEASCYSGAKRWAGGQYVYVTADEHGLNGRFADNRPWAGQTSGMTPPGRWCVQPFRISRVTTEFMNGGADLKQQIEYGGRRLHLSQV